MMGLKKHEVFQNTQSEIDNTIGMLLFYLNKMEDIGISLIF